MMLWQDRLPRPLPGSAAIVDLILLEQLTALVIRETPSQPASDSDQEDLRLGSRLQGRGTRQMVGGAPWSYHVHQASGNSAAFLWASRWC